MLVVGIHEPATILIILVVVLPCRSSNPTTVSWRCRSHRDFLSHGDKHWTRCGIIEWSTIMISKMYLVETLEHNVFEQGLAWTDFTDGSSAD